MHFKLWTMPVNCIPLDLQSKCIFKWFFVRSPRRFDRFHIQTMFVDEMIAHSSTVCTRQSVKQKWWNEQWYNSSINSIKLLHKENTNNATSNNRKRKVNVKILLLKKLNWIWQTAFWNGFFRFCPHLYRAETVLRLQLRVQFGSVLLFALQTKCISVLSVCK